MAIWSFRTAPIIHTGRQPVAKQLDGPRPKVDQADENMRLSRDRLAAATPPDRFVFRPAGGDDKGVDFHLDLLHGGEAYGFSIAGQLKAEAVAKPNTDGSFSYRIDTSNLNHLLDYPFAVYVHFAVNRNEFRFAWALDEMARLERDGVDWKEQQSFMIRFEKSLDAAGWNEIHRRLLANGRRDRHLRQQLAQTAVAQSTIRLTFRPRKSRPEMTPSRGFVTTASISWQRGTDERSKSGSAS